MSTRPGPAAVLLVLLLTVSAAAADLEPAAVQAYAAYAERATQAFVGRVGGNRHVSRFPEVAAEGGTAAAPAGEDGIIEVATALVHHWAGAVFIPGVTLQQVLAVATDYLGYERIHESIVASRLLGRDGNVYRVLLRLREGIAGVTAVLDVRSNVRYVYPGDRRAYAISRSEEIREVTDAGDAGERLLPAGRDSGYLWRAHTLTSFTERNGGVIVEMETLGLSRRFPPLLGWIIEPIARSLGRKSVETSLQEFRDAVRASRLSSN